MADLTFKDSDDAETATLSFDDAEGFHTTPDAAPGWASDDAGAVILLKVADDGMSATATPVAPGTAHVTITATNADNVTITGQSTVIVTAGEAASLSLVWAPVADVPPNADLPQQVVQISPNVPSAPEVHQAGISQSPGVTTLQGATVKLESADPDNEDDDTPGLKAPKIIPEEGDDVKAEHVGPNFNVFGEPTGSPETIVSTPVSSAVPSQYPGVQVAAADGVVAPESASKSDAVPVPASEPAPDDSAAQPETGDKILGGDVESTGTVG